ncbi:MAG: glycogen-binding domain-containing protein [Deltaproteobacteria bacterium]|nr:glycogen-binding domain-containing protein [Deltaproteobacteria bacterium]
MDSRISLFIDNELSIDEKIEFVSKVHEDNNFRNDSLELLRQEKRLRSEIAERIPLVHFKESKKRGLSFFRPFALMASSAAVMALIFFFLISPKDMICSPHRFVLYNPSVNQVEISGSFTNWEALPLSKVGPSGYWEIVLPLSEGEHRFTYILEGNQRVTDPTVLTKEQDDFGGENSILYMEI